ncbi:hypothetical protein ABIA32_001536 [Streptacidiphilus sp. MAP12-20]|uniref:DUF3631 domain-containing protein n=1 Tax=Streptacidiphilus sp. MAP12-20 TaxID=3156299 RepID=UPI003518CD36
MNPDDLLKQADQPRPVVDGQLDLIPAGTSGPSAESPDAVPAAPTAGPDPVPDGAVLLDELRVVLARYVVLPDEHALNAVTLWIAASHLQQSFQHAPRLAITGPQKRCGKSRLLDVVEATCHRPIMTVNASVAAIYRSIGDNPPTLLVDEADTIFGPKAAGDAEALRGILNGGHQRKRDTLRINGKSMELETHKTFSMAALAGIGDLPDTVMDRSVVVRMRRRSAAESVESFRTRDSDALQPLRERLAAWAQSIADRAGDMDPAMPVEDRAADTWEPLVIVADLADGTWPDLARQACRVITARESDRPGLEDYPMQLLIDVHGAFASVGHPELMPTKQLIVLLCSDEESPWPTYGPRSGGLTPRYLQMLLRDFDISSKNYRFEGRGQAKGFARTQFLDAWARYCPSVLKGAESATARSASEQPLALAEPDRAGHEPRTGPEAADRPLPEPAPQASAVSGEREVSAEMAATRDRLAAATHRSQAIGTIGRTPGASPAPTYRPPTTDGGPRRGR